MTMAVSEFRGRGPAGRLAKEYGRVAHATQTHGLAARATPERSGCVPLPDEAQRASQKNMGFFPQPSFSSHPGPMPVSAP